MKAIYAHEHITIDLSGPKNDADCHLDDRELALRGLHAMKRAGVEAVVDQTARGMGRDPAYTQALCDEAGVRVLHATGFYKEPFLPAECHTMSEKDMCALFLSELRGGMDQTGVRAGLIGEIGTGKDRIEPVEEKIFRAAARAHVESGAPICTHTTLGTMGMEQVKLLRAHGVELSYVVLSHIDLSGDLEYMLRLLDTGVNIGFDTVGKHNYRSDKDRAACLLELARRGFSGQIVVSMDLTRKSNCRALGADYLMTRFVPRLLAAGFRRDWLERILWENPARIYRL